MSANVTIISLDAEGGTVTVEAEVTALGFNNINYRLEINDTGTGVSETFSDIIGPGTSNTHSMTFTTGGVESGLITAMFTSPESAVGEQDQESWEMEVFDPENVNIVDCSVNQSEVEPGGNVSIDYEVQNDNSANAQFSYELVVGGNTIDTGSSSLFGDSQSSFIAGGSAPTTPGEATVEINLTDVQEA